VTFDGSFFRVNSKKVGGDRRSFEVTVRQGTGSVDGALQAGAHEGTSYCVRNFGSSDIDWVVDPYEPPEDYMPTGGTLTLPGTCAG